MQQEEMDIRAQSEFNMAVSYLNRLNTIIYFCNQAALDLDMYRWFHCLLTLSRELSTEFKAKDNEQEKKYKEELEPLISNYAVNRKSSKNIYDKLHDFEKFLRGILKASGLQNKMKHDPRLSLGR